MKRLCTKGLVLLPRPDHLPGEPDLFQGEDRHVGHVELPTSGGRVRRVRGKAWWLLCHPSPKARRPTHQRLRLSSVVS